MSEAMTNPNPHPRRGYPLVAWLVIVAVVGVMVWRNGLASRTSDAEWLVPMQMQGRYLVGLSDSGFPGAPKAKLYAQARETFETDTPAKRLRFAVLAGELSGPEEARRVLDGADASEEERLLGRIYQGKELSAEERATLEARLGWFGELAAGVQDEAARARALGAARRTFFGMLAVLAVALGALVVGGCLLVTLAVLAHMGKLQAGVVPGGNGGVYAETFALYLASFVVAGFLSRYLPWRDLWVGGVLMLFSLAALAWPVARGVRWADVRRDLGLYSGGFRDIPLGIGTYLSALPFLALGLLVTVTVVLIRRRMGLGDRPGAGPSHPIIGIALSGDLWAWVQMVVVACVLAPLVEETMFRGALYRHLREVGPGLPRLASVTLSVVVSGFVFAAIHPQGWLGVPVLMSLATAFALSREWRGSVVPAMIAHGINNGMATLMLWLFAA